MNVVNHSYEVKQYKHNIPHYLKYGISLLNQYTSAFEERGGGGKEREK